MRIGKIERHGSKCARSSEAVILFAVGGHRFAIAAAAVEEIRNREGLLPASPGLPSASANAPKIKNILLRDSRTYCVVEAALCLGLPESRPSRLLLLRDLRSHDSRLALSIDSIDRMAELAVLHPLPDAFQGEERMWYRGLALVGDEVIPVLNPAALLDAEELAALPTAKSVAGSNALKGIASA